MTKWFVRKPSRAEAAGRALGESIVEMVHLMYQTRTASNFWKGLMSVLNSAVRLTKKGTG